MHRAGFTLTALLTLAGVAPASAQDDAAAHGQLELTVGAVSSPGSLGLTAPVTQGGYFRLGDLPAGPSFGLGIALPSAIGGLRPSARVAWSPGRAVRSQWIPCAPGAECPSVLLFSDSRVHRLEATLGVERALPVRTGPFHSRAFVGVGIRRYEHRWKELGDPGVLFLSDGSAAETDLLVVGGLSGHLRAGSWEWIARVGAGASRQGPGRVPAAGAGPEGVDQLDFGRRTLIEYSVRLGVRRIVW